eukprot:TRINITY_DN520_c0_g1_i1.p1 TRINITY_DN520_c0_g1~~TRINITY_DN520_c0_g1_i1.p1  ORF type:complete len:663 (-),score=163.95 TRINITY_DN520_c0_g1_i1:994-2937(-)
MNLLAVERRRTDKVDWAKLLQKYIRSTYDENALRAHQQAVTQLHQLREDVRNVQDKNDTTKDLFLRYHALLGAVEMRFPISENDIHICFPWYDAYRTKKTSLFNVKFERASIMFNVGAVLSQIANIQNKSTADGVKTAANYYKMAAGVFRALHEQVSQVPEVQNASIDFSSDFLNMLTELMLANAQYCFYDRASKSNLSKANLAKISAQAGTFYDSALRLMSQPSLQGYIPKAWLQHTEIMSGVMWGEAHTCVAEDLSASNVMKYGEGVARLALANTQIENCRKLVRSVPELRELVDQVGVRVTKAFLTAEKENDSIYHDTVPSTAALSTLSGKPMVAPVVVDPIPVEDPFSALVPFAVRQSLTLYQERRYGLVSNEIKNIKDHNEIVKSALAEMNLPGAVEALESPTGIPQTLMDKHRTVASENGAAHVTELIKTLRQLAVMDGQLLDEASKTLDAEEGEDRELRTNFGPKWTRTPSHTLTAGLRQETLKYKGNWEHATKSDTYVLSKWDNVKRYVELLAGSDKALQDFVPSATQRQLVQSPAVSALKDDLTQLDNLLAEREKLRKDIQDMSTKDDITPVLMQHMNEPVEDIYRQELSKYNDITNSIHANCERQTPLLAKLRVTHKIISQPLPKTTLCILARSNHV